MSLHNGIKQNLLYAIEKLELDRENIPNLLNVDSKKINAILNMEPCFLDDDEKDLISTRAFTLAHGTAYLTPKERMRSIIKVNLMDDCKLSIKNLAKYADVPVETFNDFLNTDNPIAEEYLISIYFNINLLFRVLYTDNRWNREY